ncbi:hypothetical protein [Vibrio sonorensis]|uniref:hypothetical protein n=1 Tax=Vibrio sonorensis TaxID=1004316 RepID=UPI0008D9889B|nr:hypothetical protein [Vibrio sonorensis]
MKGYLAVAFLLSVWGLVLQWERSGTELSVPKHVSSEVLTASALGDFVTQTNTVPPLAIREAQYAKPISHGEAAPKSDTLDELKADITEYTRKSPQLDESQQEDSDTPIPPDFFDQEVTLWRSSEKAKSVYENYTETQALQGHSLDSKYFIEFDETSLDSLDVGQRFTLPSINEQQIQVIIQQQESLGQGATNWVLVDSQGNPMGNITRTKDSVEGVFTTPSGPFYLSSINGVGWLASENTLIAAVQNSFTKPN